MYSDMATHLSHGQSPDTCGHGDSQGSACGGRLVDGCNGPITMDSARDTFESYFFLLDDIVQYT